MGKKNLIPPRPVHPRSVIHHGMFGNAFVRQHMIIDERWTPDSLTQQFYKMSRLLRRHAKFHGLEKRAKLGEIGKTYQELQKECREGRKNLKSIQAGDARVIRNILTNHRQMQRLYQRMPPHLILENINQRTFVMRKERDRLITSKAELEIKLKKQLIEKSILENRIYYKDVFELEEVEVMKDLQSRLERSKVRLKAVMTINVTYKKIIEVLRSDGIFYEPILRSLDADIQDQEKFIKHILYLGSPAIDRFKILRDVYKARENKLCASSAVKAGELGYIKGPSKAQRKDSKIDHLHYKVRKYVRETNSMLELKEKFEEIEEAMKAIKMATLSSDVKDVYLRMKLQTKHNIALCSSIEKITLRHQLMSYKKQGTMELYNILHHNLAKDEIKRLRKIDKLKEAIKMADKFEETTLELNKNISKFFVLLRFSLWNINAIMKHVGPKRYPKTVYPVDYLKLPLLKFENMPMLAAPPPGVQQNLSAILSEVQMKLEKVMKAYRSHHKTKTIKEYEDEYRIEMIDVNRKEGDQDEDQNYPEKSPEGTGEKPDKNILSRGQIKSASAYLVEQRMKRDD